MRSDFKRLWLGRTLIAALAVLVALATSVAPAGIAIFDEMLRDPLVRLAAAPEAESRVVVVDIDEASLAEIGPWPWPRKHLADLVEILLGPLGARGVALDMVLPEATGSAGDMRLAALATHAPLTLSLALDYLPRHPPLAQGVPGKSRRWRDGESFVEATGYIGNHALFGTARCVGNIGFVPDADGAIRRLPALSRLGEQAFPPLAVALMECAGIEPPDPALRTDKDGYWRIPYRHNWTAYTVVPANLVLAESVPADLFAGRLVLIGSSSLGLSDRVTTPLSTSTSGVMVHAAGLSALLNGASPRLAGAGFPIAAAWLAASLVIWLALLPRMAPLAGIALLAGLCFGWIRLAAWLIDTPLPLLPMLAAYATLLVAGIPFEWWWSRRESARVLRIFSHYVAPSVLAELLRQHDERPLVPRFREVTVLIADMEGYTGHTATSSLDAAAQLTTGFLDCLTRPVLDGGGTLDKYTGDGLVAFWGAPLPCADHAERARAAALRIQAAVTDFGRIRAGHGLPPVRVRIGIESGLALVGDLGTTFRSTYTAVGDCINLAAKLEQAARALPVDIVIGPGAASSLGGKGIRPLGRLSLGNPGTPGGMALECWTPAA